MKNKLLLIFVTCIMLVHFPKSNFAQAPTLGTSADFVLFTTVGAVSNTGISHLTGNVGSNSGSSTGFGNVDGGMHNGDPTSAQAALDVLVVYNQLNLAVPTFFPTAILGNGQTLNAGVYEIPGAASLNADLTFDAQGDPNAVFIIQIGGAFSINANSKVKLINGALACNIFWKTEGLVNMAAGASMKGTIVVNNAAITMSAGDTLEGRAFAISGAITITGVLAYTPIGCGSPFLSGPVAPDLGASACFAVFSASGAVTNTGSSMILGDVGTNLGSATGYNALDVTGTIHATPDGFTAQAATDLTDAYAYLNALPFDIELLYPSQFGNSLVLTPHTYIMNGAVSFTDTVFLDGEDNPNAVFVIQVKGAFSTATYSYVKLIRGTKAKNVYWMVDGAVLIDDFSEFSGTIVCNNNMISINSGVILNGRSLTTNGALATAAITVVIPSTCYSSKLDPSVCDVTLTDYAVAITANSVPGATAYRFRIQNVTFGYQKMVTTATPQLPKDWVNDLDYNRNYRITVAFKKNGVWSDFGDACLVRTPNHWVRMENNSCNVTLAALNQPLNCKTIGIATNYKYLVENVGLGYAQVFIKGSADTQFKISSLSGILYGTTYTVKVSYYYNGVWSPYGPDCDLTTPATEPKLTTADCNITLSAMSQDIHAKFISGSTNYRFLIENVGLGFSKLHTTGSSVRTFKMSDISGISTNTTYAIKVAYYQNGMWSVYGTTCNVTSAATALIYHSGGTMEEANGTGNVLEEIYLDATPNPNNGNFTVSSSHEGTYTVCNQLGQVIQTISLNKENSFRADCGNLDNGIYFISGTIRNESGSYQLTRKVMVVN